MDEDYLQAINWDAKVYEFIYHDRKEWDLHSIASLLPTNVLTYMKAVPIPTSARLFCKIKTIY